MIVGCYDLHLYCENAGFDGAVRDERARHEHREFPHEFGQGCETGGEARQQARNAGWKLDYANGLAWCPKCVADGLTTRHAEGSGES